jgi:hypothetical protein
MPVVLKNHAEKMIEKPTAKVNPISHQKAPNPGIVRCLAELGRERTS